MVIKRSCLMCTSSLDTSETRRIFCCKRCANDYWHDHRYECYYCDEPADTEDHLYPQSVGLGVGQRVPACSECNELLSDCYPNSHICRMKTLHCRLSEKYAADLNCPSWTEEELSELTGWTRSDRERDEARRERAQYRLDFLWKRIEQTVGLQENLGEEPTELEDFSFNGQFDTDKEEKSDKDDGEDQGPVVEDS